MPSLRTPCALILLAVGVAPVAAQDAALSSDLRATLAAKMTESLRTFLDAWYPRTIDEEHGGFLSRFDYQWNPEGAQDKMIVTQARHVWTNARAAHFFIDDPTFLPLAAHGFAFLRDVMWDDEYGGFFWLVERDGTPKPQEPARFLKQSYGNAFGIYGLAAYYAASGDPGALELAKRAFLWLEEHAHDPVHGGYFNYTERDGTPLRDGYGDTPPKDQNSSIHLLEAFYELYNVWPDALLRERLKEMLVLIRDTIVVEPGTLTLFSTADWQPISFRDAPDAVREANYYFDHVSFGHDVETAYLMLEAAEALGLGHDARTLEVGKRMVDHALRTGWDGAVGGFYDGGYYLQGDDELTVVRDTKNWWAQAEGLNTLLILADLYPDDPLRYHEKFLAMWGYINGFLIDHERGGWYEGGLDKQPELRYGPKAHLWKASYHDGRALMSVIEQLRSSPDTSR